jgi:flagellar protein FliL
LAGKRKVPLTIIILAFRLSAGRAALYRVRGSPVGIESIFKSERPYAMADNDQAEGAADAAAAPAAKGKLKLIFAVVAVLAIAGGGATWFFFLRHHGEEGHAEAAAPAPKPASYVEVPDMMVNLIGLPGERVQYLKVKLVLEVKEEKQVESIKPSLPRVTDIFQTYLRELRPADLNGSAGLFRLKEELTRRVNAAVSPNQVSAVLFKEVVVQ